MVNTRRDAANIGFSDEDIFNEITKPIVLQKIPFVQCLHEEALVTFELWQNKTDKVEY